MNEPVIDPAFWRDRMYSAFVSGERHRTIFKGSREQFEEVERVQQCALSPIRPGHSILDVGCGYGRLLEMLAKQRWRGQYVGYDSSPDLIEIARKWWPDQTFLVADLAADDAPKPPRSRWAVAMWVKTMMVGNGYGETWDKVEAWMRRNADDVIIIN